MNTVLQGNFLTILRQTIQTVDDQTADGIIVFTGQIGTESIVNIVQLHAAFYQISVVGHLLDQFFFILIIFVTDLTDDFFQ